MAEWIPIDANTPITAQRFLVGFGRTFHVCSYWRAETDAGPEHWYVVHGKNHQSWARLARYWTHYKLETGPNA